MATKKYLIVNTSTGPAITQESTVDSSAGAGDSGKIPSLDASGKLDSSFMPTGFGADSRTVTAGENLSAGDLVYLNSSGEAFKADANSQAKEAIGFTLTSITAASSGTIYLGSGIITGLTGLTAGSRYFLSATTAGGISTSKPTGAADIVQQVGFALSSTELYFEPQDSVLLT